MTLKNKYLDVYFHMSNHYRKLRMVKSATNSNLSPKGCRPNNFGRCEIQNYCIADW